jgi:hypothetical protein
MTRPAQTAQATLPPTQPPLPTVSATLPPATATPSLQPTEIPTETPPAGQGALAYGIVYPYPPGEWPEGERPAIRQHLVELRRLHVDTVLQVFSSRISGEEQEKGWLIFLDEAQNAGIQVIARLYPANERSGSTFDYTTIRRFLNVVAGHPALLAYLGLHEPFEDYTSPQLQDFYREIKTIAPGLPVAHLLGDIAAFDQSTRFLNRKFSGGICDICFISYYPAQLEQGKAIFDRDALVQLLQANRSLVSERDPTAQLWFLGQAFALADSHPIFRMPTPAEMEELFTVARQEGVDGFLWYPWIHEAYDQVLGDPQSQAQQEAVGEIGQSLQTPLPDAEP